MSINEVEDTLKRFEELRSNAIPEGNYNAPLFQELVNELMAVNIELKPSLFDFAKSLKNELFKEGITIIGFNLDSFKPKSASKETAPAKTINLVKYDEVQTEFSDLLIKLATVLKEHFEILKGYTLLKLENNPLESYKLLVLYDDTYFIQPINKILQKSITGFELKKLSEFQKEITDGNYPNGNLLCFLLLIPRPNDKEKKDEIIDNIKTILEIFKSISNISINNLKDIKSSSFSENLSKEDFIEEIEYILSSALSNGSIPHEEEKIIKKVFKDFQTPLLIYKTLKGGNSGSKVIEVRPKKEFGNQHEKRYIVKYSTKNDQRKIEIEKKRFSRWIEGYKKFNEYECSHYKTSTHEAIRYSYAISDSELESYSYSEILNKPKNKFHTEKKETIESLFDISLFQVWNDSIEKKNCKVSELYYDYVNPIKIKAELCKILNLSSEEVESNQLIKNFNLIWEYSSEFHIKVCHGDLHSENFFRDSNGIYLIDFGYTDMRHSVVDHTSLECSIKFKHIPFYIPIDELRQIETELLSKESFQESNLNSQSKRSVIIDLLQVIRQIRSKSTLVRGDSSSNDEYYISLFMMTFRQIQYSDMNQLYALRSAELLSEKIVNNIKSK
jgi:hypothetical protein